MSTARTAIVSVSERERVTSYRCWRLAGECVLVVSQGVEVQPGGVGVGVMLVL